MLIFIQIVFLVYILAINAYGFILVYLRKNEEENSECKPNNSKLIIAALLGGALGCFIAMFIYKYRLDSLILMVFLPVIAVVNAFIVWQLYRNNFGFIDNYVGNLNGLTYYVVLFKKHFYPFKNSVRLFMEKYNVFIP